MYRTGRWPVREPVQTLANTAILIPHPPQAESKCKRISPSPPYLHANFDRISVQYFFTLKPLTRVFLVRAPQRNAVDAVAAVVFVVVDAVVVVVVDVVGWNR